MSSVSKAVRAGLMGRCPNCEKGKLFSGYLKLAPRCSACGADFTVADVGDGASVFVMLLVGAVVVPLAFILQFSAHAPTWVTMTIACAAAVGLCVGCLRPFKALLFALQWTHKAEQAKLERHDPR